MKDDQRRGRGRVRKKKDKKRESNKYTESLHLSPCPCVQVQAVQVHVSGVLSRRGRTENTEGLKAPSHILGRHGNEKCNTLHICI